MDGDKLRKLLREEKWDEVLEYLNSEDVSEEDKREILFNIDEDGTTSLHFASSRSRSENNSIEVIKKMLQIGGMKLMIKRNPFNGWTALHHLFNSKKSDEFYRKVMYAFSEAGGDMGKLLLIEEDDNRWTPIDIAIMRGVPQSVIDRLYEIAPETKQKVNTVGYSDNAKNTEDQLDYRTYAKALVEVVQSVEESSGASFAVGLFAPWGTGKTKLWQLIRDETMKKDNGKQQTFLKKMIPHPELAFFTKLCFVVRDSIAFLSCGNHTYERIEDEEIQSSAIDEEEAENIAVFIIVATCSLFGIILLILRYKISTIFQKTLRNRKMLESSINLSKKVKAALQGQTITNFDMMLPCSFWTCARKLILLGSCIVILTLKVAFKMIAAVVCFITPRCCTTKMKKMFKNSMNFMGLQLDHDGPELSRERCYKHIFVEFNAWVYNGTDNLWASLMKTMIDNIENEYPPNALRWHRVSVALSDEKPDDSLKERKKKRKEAWERFKVRTIVSALVAVIGVCLAVFLVLRFNADCTKKDAQTNASLWCNSATRESVGALLIITSPLPFLGQVFKIFSQVLPNLFSSPVDLLLHHAAKSAGSERHDFGASTGFMGEVKKEMEYIFDFLDSELIIDAEECTWDARLSIFVDDLDRCKPETVVEVMQAIHLLLEGRNIRDAGGATCWLAIDTRIVKSCIDSEYGEVLRDAGVDGNDYLEKIIQLPFCIPEMTAKNKDSLMRKMLRPGQMRLRDIAMDLNRSIDFLRKDYVNEEDSDLPPDLHVLNKHYSILEFSNPHTDDYDAEVKSFLKNVLKDNLSSGKMKNNVFKQSNLEDNEDLAKVFLTYNQHIGAVVNLIFQESPSSSTSTTQASPCISPPETRGVSAPSPGGATYTTREATNANHMSTPGTDSIMLPEERNAIAQLFPGKARTLKRVMNIYNVARNVAELRGLALENDFYRKLLLVILLAEIWPFRMSWMLQIAEDELQEEVLAKIRQRKGKRPKESRTGPAGVLKNLLKIGEEASSIDGCHFAKIPLNIVYSEIVQKVMYSSPDAVSELSQDGDPQIFEYLLEGVLACELTLADIYPSDCFEKDFDCVSLRPFLFNMHRYTLEKRSADADNIIMCCDEITSDSLNLKYTKKTDYYEKKNKKNAGCPLSALDSGEGLYSKILQKLQNKK